MFLTFKYLLKYNSVMSRHPINQDVFQAIADPTRRALLDALREGEQPVNQLAGRFRITLSAVSQHMRVLRESGLVQVRAIGRERYYTLRAEPLREVADWVQRHESFWQRKLDALGAHLDAGARTQTDVQPAKHTPEPAETEAEHP